MRNILFLLGLAVAFAACRQKVKHEEKSRQETYYTCSMHPQVHQDHPGNCPICQMSLIKVETTGKAKGAEAERLMLTDSQIQLAGIRTDTIKEEHIGDEKTLTGTVTTNENKAEQISARVAGRIEKLYVRTVGEEIAVGQPLYQIYSEELLEAEKEYLLAKQQQKILHNPDIDYKQLIDAAEHKLLLWGLSSSQIRSLSASGKVSANVTVKSNIHGTVSDISVHEGDYVTEGSPVLKTDNISDLWVEAQLYASEVPGYQAGDAVNVMIPDLGGQAVKGKIDFINPELSGQTKVDLIRVSIPNNQGMIRPGMLAYISIAGGDRKMMAVPVASILTDGKTSKVWVKNLDGSFSPKIVVPGAGNQSYAAILSGLNAGDVVVTSGAYLLNSEAIFKNGKH